MFVPLLVLAVSTPGAQPAAKPVDDSTKLICRKVDRTGSRLASDKVCLTRAQWEERARNDERELNDMLKLPCAELTSVSTYGAVTGSKNSC
jgi:hypothetical protein